jgi:hypothetical protein
VTLSPQTLVTVDPEAAAFIEDARAALAACNTPRPAPQIPTDWPITRSHRGPTLTAARLHALRGHALRISHQHGDTRQAIWVAAPGRLSREWTVQQGIIGEPAGVRELSGSWERAVRVVNELVQPGRVPLGDRLTVDEWLPEFTTVCLAHRDDCAEHPSGHNFVQRRTLARYPEGTYRPCGGGSAGVLGGGGHDGEFRYRYQVDGRWRMRFGCRRHHCGLLGGYLAEADGTVTVQLMDDHVAPPAA